MPYMGDGSAQEVLQQQCPYSSLSALFQSTLGQVLRYKVSWQKPCHQMSSYSEVRLGRQKRVTAKCKLSDSKCEIN